MAYDPIVRLREGNVDFLLDFWMTSYDTKSLIERLRKETDKIDIIQLVLPKLIKRMPVFLFEVMYDIDEFEKPVKKLINSKYKPYYEFNTEKIRNLLYNTSWGEKYIFNNFDSFLKNSEMNKMEIIVRYAYGTSKIKNKWIKMFTKTKNMNARAMFIKTIIILYPLEAAKLLCNFEDIFIDKPEVGEQISFLPNMISDKDLSEIIVLCIECNINADILNKLKIFLLNNYKKNDLAGLLINPTNSFYKESYKKVFLENPNELFLTSKKHQWSILNRYKELLSGSIVSEYNHLLKLEEELRESKKFYFSPISGIYASELGDKLKLIVDKYLSLSKSEDIKFLGNGSMSFAFQIGDYVLKLGRGKWSYEDEICPNLYLILKNLEEYYIRDNKGFVVANMEVQKILTKKADNIDSIHFKLFHDELHRLGYYTDDPRSNGRTGENFGILDSYKEADYRNVDLLPDTFKEVPLVLYDRDRVFKIGRHPKVIRESIGD